MIRQSTLVLLTLVLGCDDSDVGSNMTPLSFSFVRNISWNPTDSVLLDPVDFDVSDDGIFFVDEATPSVRWITRKGELRQVIGSRGAGPGELRSVEDLDVNDNSIVVGDSRNRRMTIFAKGGQVRRTIRAEANVSSVQFDELGRVHVAYHSAIGGDAAASRRLAAIYDHDGSLVHTYGTYEPRGHPLASGLHNTVRYANTSDGSIWQLYTYRGIVDHVDSRGVLLQRIELPVPDWINLEDPYVEVLSEPGELERVSIIRLPIADDIAVDDGVLFVSQIRLTPEMKVRSKLVAISRGEILVEKPLPIRARRIAAHDGLLYVLRREPTYGLTEIDVWAIDG